ncbi:hypothetical protein GQ55_8G116700 [Panicum hallii var. hallii]|uniref:Uncharacterized protein n=1 Tax=Panicum hallii var. hallii TaxID=1504633 RepID=A0A2T7CMN3_9POAL|nr:hypothetical protein GQ55_8G116700 [Panicum hallii var. hallii]
MPRVEAAAANHVAGWFPPSSQHPPPKIRKEALSPCFQKLHPHGGGHIQGAFDAATMVIQTHGSGQLRLSRTLLQHRPLLGRAASSCGEGCEKVTHSLAAAATTSCLMP